MSEHSDGKPTYQQGTEHPLQNPQAIEQERQISEGQGSACGDGLTKYAQPPLFWCNRCKNVFQDCWCPRCSSDSLSRIDDQESKASHYEKHTVSHDTTKEKFDKKNLLKCFRCRLKPQVGLLHDPVLTSNGESYEKEHIEKHLHVYGTDPVSNKKLSKEQLYENKTLKEAISAYLEERPLDVCFKCPLTRDFFKDPVTLPSGITYERRAILELKKSNLLSQRGIQAFKDKKLYPNKAVRDAVNVFTSQSDYQPPQKEQSLATAGQASRDLSKPMMKLLSLDSSPSSSQTVPVFFHVMIPRHSWETDHPIVRIRCGHQKLGGWKCDLALLQLERKFEDGILQMGVIVKIPLECFSTEIPYAYVVYSPRAAKEKTAQEFIYEVDASSIFSRNGKVCRCLPKKMPTQHNKGVIHQYDTIAYPPGEYSGWFSGWPFTQRSALPSPEKMRQMCYGMYMAEIEDRISRDENIPMRDLCDMMVDIFHSMFHQDFVFDKKPTEHRKLSFPSVVQEMTICVSRIAQHLLTTSSADCSSKIVSSFTVLLFIGRLIKSRTFSQDHFKTTVGELLQVMSGTSDGQPDVKGSFTKLEKSICSSSTPSQFKQECVEMLKLLLQTYAGHDVLSWLSVVPYYHFLNGEVVPYAQLVFEDLWKNPTPLCPKFPLSESSKNELVKQAHKLALFDVDPLLVPLCFFICPKTCIKESIHPLHSIHWLLWRMRSGSSFFKNENLILNIVVAMKQELVESHLNQTDVSVYISKSLELLDNLWKFPHLPFTVNAHCIALVTIGISMSNDPAEKEAIATKVSSYIDNWMKFIMGVNEFGGKRHEYKKEIEKWNHLIKLFPVNDWIASIVRDIMRLRLNKVESMAKLKILCDYSRDSSDASKMVTILIAECIPDLLKEESRNEAILYLCRSKVESKYMATALEYVYNHRTLLPLVSTSLDDLLTWEHWLALLELFANDPAVYTAEISSVCCGVCSYIQKLATLVSHYAIHVALLKQLASNEESFCKLVDVSNKIRASKSQQQFKRDLNKCKDMLAAYDEHKQQLLIAVSLLTELSTGTVQVTIQGLPELQDLLTEDRMDEKFLSDICISDNGAYSFPFFDCAEELAPILTTLRVMNRDHHNVFFSRESKQLFAQMVKQQQSLSFTDIVTTVWTPAFEYCVQVADSLLNRSMTLEDVSRHFEAYDRGQLSRQIHDLVHGVGLCFDVKEYYDSRVVNDCIGAIEDFRKVMRCSRAAAVFLQLKDRLSLNGDFSNAEVLQAIDVSSQSNFTLRDINLDVVSAGKRLESAAEENNLHCLKKLSECCDILLWIKSIITDVADLQAFVTLALETGTCGEDQYSKDRMSNLRSIGSDLAPLIFNIQPDMGFEDLTSELDIVWAALKSNPKLPELLESCNGDLKWYNEVKNTQGNVEATSFGQLSNILNYGQFTVGNSVPEICHLVSDVISLDMIAEDDKQLPKLQYSLSELEDLESRLVLISGEDVSQEKADVAVYLKMLKLVRQTAEALIFLQQSGKVRYIGWTLKFNCSCACNVLNSLTNLAKFIEEELDLWKREVENTRAHFYELNCYTTKQLLVLRKHIKQILDNNIDEHDSSVVAHALSLLQSIYSDISKEIVVEVLENTDEPDEEQLTSTADILQHCHFPCSTEGDASSDVSTHFSVPYTSEDSPPQTPKFTDKKHVLYTALIDYYAYDEYLAEKATNMFDDEDEAVMWCEDHLDDPAFTNPSISMKPVESSTAAEASESTFDMSIAVENSRVISTGGSFTGEYVKQLSVQHTLEIERHIFEIQEPNECITEAYFSLEDLGKFLTRVAKRSGGQAYTRQRPFPRKSGLKIGVPNLIVTNEENVLKTVLSLYTEDKSLPLPSPEEVLICSETTTSEEVILLWRRAINDPGFKRLFCLVHPEKLSYSDADRALQLLFEFIKGKKGFRLVIVCSSVDESKSHVISKLHLYRRAYQQQEDKLLKEFLGKHLTTQSRARSKTTQVTASSVDKDLSTVRVVISNRAGMGKSLYARRLSQKLGKITSSDKSTLVSVPVHGPDVTADEIITLLDRHHLDPLCKIYHFDIASSVVDKVANVLFSLLVLGGLCDSQGRVWRSHISQLYCIEITLPEKQVEIHGETSTLSLLGLLPKVHCISPVQVWNRTAKYNTDTVHADKDELQSVAYQRVYQFLNKHDNSENLDDFKFLSDTRGNLQEVIQVICKYSGVSNPSWREIRNFVQFLNIQLNSAESSLYLKDAIEGLKTFVVKFAIRMSKDFATSSLSGEIDAEEGLQTRKTTLQQLQILDRHRWEERPHPYIFFNKDKATATFVGFTVSDSGDLLNPLHKGELIERSIASSSLVKSLKRLKFDEDHSTLSSDQLVKKLCMFLGIPERDNPDKSYVLTRDNFIKILGIQMRFRCGIPVVLMGETGCGKTRLIRFMCDLANTAVENASTLLILKVHGGTTREDVVRKVEEAKQRAVENEKQDLDTVLFFDEANTTEAIGLIKEVLCDKQVQGQRITERINFVAACNPYRRHTEEMIRRLESAGLGYYVKGSDTNQKLGDIPLRQLVYRVLELPPSLRPHVYDFGRLNDETEVEYTKKIVENQVYKIQELGYEFVEAIAKVLASCQAYMRNKKDECGFVSLRDVERAMIVFEFFYRKMDDFDGLIKRRAENDQRLDTSHTSGKATRSVILALSVCYHARLQERDDFEVTISKTFARPLCLPGGAEQFGNEILWCQDVLLNEMKIPQNIARNVALRENVFMMTICIELRIPLFLVGKPGSSKSLAKTIVSSSLSGRSSKSELLKKFKQVHMFSFQCSKYSTPESIVQVFKTAKSFQEKQDTEKYVSVVVLDEVGLAEDSPALPLKALHPLLEDGTEGGDDSNQIVERKKRVAFVGISNWALDPAKMNRGVMVTRGKPTTEDLVDSAVGICHTKPSDPTLEKLRKYFKPLADCYEDICKDVNKKREFYGLRDYYCLIKMLYWLCEKSGTLNSQQFEHAIKRNFGGAQDIDPWKIFKKCLIKRSLNKPRKPDDDDVKTYSTPDCTPNGLIYSSLLLTSKSEVHKWEDRYLLFLTENYTALETIYSFLSSVRGDETSTLDQEPYILFGSSFPRDKEYTQTCRNINQIKLCMETGRIVILLNLENLYESLYDALNQYYLVHGGKRYVDLGLQTHRMKCQVHPNFRLILIAESQTVYDKFPTPLINRLEKHFVLSKTLLEDWQKKVLIKLEAWIKAFVSLQPDESELEDAISEHFQPSDVFVGYKDDTPAAIVLQATKNTERFKSRDLTSSWAKQFQTTQREKPVFTECKHLLLKITSPDALTRLSFTTLPKDEQEELNFLYYNQQCHRSVDALLLNLITTADKSDDGLLIQVTTHSHLLDPQQKKNLEYDLSTSAMNPNWKVHDFLLQEFDTEEDFVEKIKYAFEDECQNTLLLIQCDSGHLCGDLIACARYRLYDLRAKAIEDHCTTTHVLLIVHLPRKTPTSSFVGFQGSPWICYHLDELQEYDDDMLSTEDALQKPISELFCADSFDSEFDFSTLTDSDEDLGGSGSGDEASNSSSYQCRRLHNCIQAAASKLQDTDDSSERATQRIETLLQVIPKSGLTEIPLNECTFHGALVKRMKRLLVLYEEKQESTVKWFQREALNSKKLQHSGTFRNSLGREIEEILIMFLAGIIAAVDRDCNLDLVSSCKTTSEKVVYKLWINMFLNGEVCPLDLEQMVSGQLPEVGSYSEANFCCKLPFSWIIRSTLTSSIEHSTDLKSQLECLNRVCAKLQCSLLGQLLINADPSGEANLERLYLHDFVRSTYKCTRRKQGLSDMEFQLCEIALDAACKEFLKSTEASLLHYVAAVHIQYTTYETQLSWFSETVSNCPGLLDDLVSPTIKHQIGEKSYMTLPVYAANQALLYQIGKLDAALADGTQKKLIQWLEKAQKLQETTSSVLDWANQDEITTSARHHWQQVRALQMLIEHVVSKNDSLIHYARRLLPPLKKKDADLSKEATFTRVISLLGKLSVVLQKKNMDMSLSQGITLFFMELISNMCFGVLPPEESVIRTVVGIALSPSSSVFAVDADTAPALSVFLLQQLLKYEYEQAVEHVQVIFDQVEDNKPFSDSALAQLQLHCILGYENLLRSRIISPTETVIDLISRAKELIVRDHYVSAQSRASSVLGMAELRCSLNLVVHILRDVCDPSETSSPAEFLELIAAIQQLKERIPKRVFKSLDMVTVFLLRTITRKYGYSSLVAINGLQEILNWGLLLPNVDSFNELLIDPFVIHRDNPHYSTMRQAVDEAVYTTKGQIMQDNLSLTRSNAVPFMLVLYEKVTLTSIDDKQCIDEAQGGLLSFMLSKPCEQLSELIHNTAEKMIKNDLGNHLKVKMNVSATQKLVSALVVHAASVFMCIQEKAPLVGLFAHLLKGIGDMDKTYLPTMPDVFECSNQHKFTHPFKKSTACVDMQCEIPPIHSEKTRYCSRQGYMLRPVQACCDVPSGQRNLQPASCHIIRVLMHAALYWASSEMEGAQVFLLRFLQVDDTTDLTQFCWDHLKHDLNCLSKAIGRSIDESVLLVHMVLRDIYNKPFQGKDKPDDTLPTPHERIKWEEKFDAMYLKPVLKGLEDKMHATIHKNPKKEHNELYCAVYEKLLDVSEEMQWSYYPQLTIDQLSHVICQENMIPFSKMPSILSLFLDQEPLLRATQYLPKIVKLQQYMHERFHHRVTFEEAQQLTVRDLFHQREQESPQFSQEYTGLFEALKAAWNLVKEALHHYAKEECLPACFDEDTSLEFLIPTTNGPGRCTIVLVRFLVNLHNTFLQECNELVSLSWKQGISSVSKKQKEDQPRSYRRNRTVRLSRIQPCNLLDYEQDIIPVVLLHCYQTKPYKWHFHNLAALEKHLLHKFVDGKPIITEEFPLVTFKQETSIKLASDIAAIRQNVRQKELPLKIKLDISTELDEVQKLHQTFEDIEIVLHFLATTCYSSGKKPKPTLPLRDYFENTLNMRNRPFSSKVKEHCNLEHILSIWRTLGKNLAKQHLLNGQEPFDSVPAEFDRDFKPSIHGEFDKVVASIDGEEFLSILYEVIVTRINNVTMRHVLLVGEEKDESQSLVEHLVEYIRRSNLPQIDKLSEEFPEGITLQQAVGVWKYIAKNITC